MPASLGLSYPNAYHDCRTKTNRFTPTIKFIDFFPPQRVHGSSAARGTVPKTLPLLIHLCARHVSRWKLIEGDCVSKEKGDSVLPVGLDVRLIPAVGSSLICPMTTYLVETIYAHLQCDRVPPRTS